MKMNQCGYPELPIGKYEGYLTEEKLGILLNSTGLEVIPQFKIGPYRVDYAVKTPDNYIFFEFDGDGHYRLTKQMSRDKKKDELLKATYPGCKIERIPYFVQYTRNASFESIELIDSIIFENVAQSYPDMTEIERGFCLFYPDTKFKNGFIDKKAVLPADFNEIGVENFYCYLMTAPLHLRFEILESLKAWRGELSDEEIYPLSWLSDAQIKKHFIEELDKDLAEFYDAREEDNYTGVFRLEKLKGTPKKKAPKISPGGLLKSS